MTSVGAVVGLWRFPVKSMLGEQVDAVDVAEGGIVGDRAYALIDAETGKVVSAKHPRKWGRLLGCRATLVAEPRPGEPAPPVLIELADGTEVRSDAPDVDAVLSEFVGRRVTLARSAPVDYTIDEYIPDQPDVRPEGQRDVLTEIKLGAAFFDARGLPAMVPEGSFFDLMPLSVLTTSSLARLAELEPGSRFDQRRFRMNVIVDSAQPGFVENGWIGRSVRFGDEGAQLTPVIPTPRCVMTNLAQQDLPNDPAILKATATHNRLDVAGQGLYPCVGVYAITGSAGRIRTGDPVRIGDH